MPEARSRRHWGAVSRPRSPDLHAGETVLDLGSGAGADVLISARRVGPTGRAIGLDMTDEMLELARRNAGRRRRSRTSNPQGHLEEHAVADANVDVVISNCVINLSGDKPRSCARPRVCCKPGGRFAVSDVIADPDMDTRPARTWPRGRAASPER